MILVIDNFDSFTWNLVEMLSEFDEVEVVRNNQNLEETFQKTQAKGVVISPGPGKPEDTGNLTSFFKKHYKSVPFLGVCLGHQFIGTYFGASLIRAAKPMHGKLDSVFKKSRGFTQGIPSTFKVMRYHSLILDTKDFPDSLEVVIQSSTGEIMGIQHKNYNLAGVQFHPESILTEYGRELISNWTESLKNSL